MKKRIAVIGGGASGMMAAITAARHGAHVTIYEAKERLGKKILATGNGKCNYTNRRQSNSCYRGEHPEFAMGPLSEFSVEDTLLFFKSIGIKPKEKNGYVYPNSGQASSVAEALSMEVREQEVHVIYDTVTEIIKAKKGFLVVSLTKKESFDRVILCCGSPAGLPEKTEFLGYRLAKNLGIGLVPEVPALVQLRCREKLFKTISGVRTEGIITLYVNGKKIISENGELLFTEYGISGIPVFQISRFASRALLHNEQVVCCIDFLPDDTVAELMEQILQRMKQSRHKTAEEILIGLLNHKLNYVLLKECGINPTAPAKDEFRNAKKAEELAEKYKNFSCHITAANPISCAQVCAGGIDTSQLCSQTMRLKDIPGLYAAGELIDIDGTCGGYNLQWAWSSGYVAGLHAAQDEI